MATYSHRIHRGFREAYRLFGVVAVGTAGLVTVAFFAPWTALGLLALVGLAVLGAAALGQSGAIAEGTVDDLRQAGRPGSSPLHVEVGSHIALDRPVFVGGRPSPHGRRPRIVPPAERGGGLSRGDGA